MGGPDLEDFHRELAAHKQHFEAAMNLSATLLSELEALYSAEPIGWQFYWKETGVWVDMPNDTPEFRERVYKLGYKLRALYVRKGDE